MITIKRFLMTGSVLVLVLVLTACTAQATPPTAEGQMPDTGNTSGQEMDRLFIEMMVPHHQGALEMAKIAQDRAEHPEIKAMAEAILSGQTAEVEQMLDWMDAWYGTRTVPAMQDMPMLPGMESMGHGGHSTMDMAADVETLRNAPEPFDKAFLDAMIIHHQSAIDAANVTLQQASRPEIKQMAQAIIETQQQEIDQMQTWKTSWYPE